MYVLMEGAQGRGVIRCEPELPSQTHGTKGGGSDLNTPSALWQLKMASHRPCVYDMRPPLQACSAPLCLSAVRPPSFTLLHTVSEACSRAPAACRASPLTWSRAPIREVVRALCPPSVLHLLLALVRRHAGVHVHGRGRACRGPMRGMASRQRELLLLLLLLLGVLGVLGVVVIELLLRVMTLPVLSVPCRRAARSHLLAAALLLLQRRLLHGKLPLLLLLDLLLDLLLNELLLLLLLLLPVRGRLVLCLQPRHLLLQGQALRNGTQAHKGNSAHPPVPAVMHV